MLVFAVVKPLRSKSRQECHVVLINQLVEVVAYLMHRRRYAHANTVAKQQSSRAAVSFGLQGIPWTSYAPPDVQTRVVSPRTR